MENRSGAHEWLKKWNTLHPNSKLEQDVLDQWQKGNRGEHPDWK
jgi:hypothetical protein